ncbi:Serine/threonine-protein kinase ULK1 [Acipenser ruthenus]|uniref:Serine/threonine-protein kinase ULK1 n=1 Tax=Acipenser ruthenus TaxID=7906 RepID=A0A444UWN8_ACIRT|nr:Serine/threonine-protein kinase ULK1 [Acipenser ruthenus]
MQQLRAKTLASPTQDSPGFLHGLKDSAGSSKDSSCDMEDFVMVPVQFSSDIASEATGEKPVLDSLMCSGSSLLISAGLGSQGKTPSPSPSFSNSPSPSGRPTEFSASNYGQSVPIPVPTQIHNYQRMEQNLHCPSQHVSPRSGPPVRKSSSASPLGFGRSGTSPPFPGDHGTAFSSRRLSAGGSKPYQPSPQGLTVPEHLPRHGMGSRLHSAPTLSEGGANFCRQKIKKQHSDPVVHRQCSQPQQVPSLQPGRQLRSSPKLSELVHRSPLPTILGSPTKAMPPFEFPKPPSSQNLVTLLAQQGLVLTPTRNRTIPDLKELGQPFCQQTGPSMRPVEENKGAFGRSLSAGRLSEMLLKAAFGGQVLDSGSRESLNTERPMDTAPPSGDGADLHSGVMVVGSGCPAPVVFTVGSPPSGSTPPQTNRTRMFSVGSSSSLSSGGSFSGRQFLTGTCADGCEGPSSLRYGFSDPVAASLEGGVTFEAPELPEETLMEQEHTETLRSLRFTLAFVHCVMEIAATKGMVTEGGSSVTSSFQLQESMVADQISLLSREWSYAEQLVLYMKTTELLSASLHTAMESIKQGKLCPSTTVKQAAPVPMPSYPSSGSASSCSSSSTSHLASPPQSVAEMQQLRAKTLASPTQDSPGFLHGLKDSAGSSKDSSCDMEDFVMVPVQFSSDIASEATGEKPVLDSLMCSGSSLLISAGLGSQGKTPSPSPSFSNSPSPSGRPTEFSASNYGQSVPIPVPTQIHNYQRMEQNLHCPSQHVSPRSGPPVRKSSSASPLGFGRSGTSPPFPGDHGTAFSSRRLSAGGSKPYQPSPQVGTIPEVPGQTFPLGSETRSRLQGGGLTVPEHLPRHGMGSRLHSAPNLSEGGANFCRQKIKKQHSDPVVHRQCSQPQQVPSLQPGRQLRSSPKLSELVHRSPLPTILGSPTKAMPPFEFHKPPSSQNLVTLLAQQGLVLTPTRNRTIPDLKELGQPFCQQTGPSMRPVEENKGAFGRSLSAGRLSEMLLKAAFGGQVLDSGSRESLNTERPMDTAPPSGDGADLHSGVMVVGSGCPAPVVFTVGSPPSGSTPPQTNRTRMFSVGSSSSLSSGGSFSGRQFLTGTCADGCEGPSSLRYGFSDPVAASLEGGVTFEAPELPEETLMEQEHTETLRSLRFTLAFVHCVMEIAATKGMVTEGGSSVTSSFQLQESMVADQISLLSREWSYAEQLVLYMKTTELLSASLHTAMESIKQGKLCPSTTVKQVIKKLNELYKSSVSSCRSLNARLQRFFYDKQKLMDRINSITADKLIYNHTVHMIQSAALDEMFHHGEASVQRYHKALLLMEGLSLIINEQADVENISKCE